MIPKRTVQFILLVVLLLLAGCSPAVYSPEEYPVIDRSAALPEDIEKRSPATDSTPPILHSDEYEAPIPVTRGHQYPRRRGFPLHPAGWQNALSLLHPRCADPR